jgi:hypothetical protein
MVPVGLLPGHSHDARLGVIGISRADEAAFDWSLALLAIRAKLAVGPEDRDPDWLRGDQ